MMNRSASGQNQKTHNTCTCDNGNIRSLIFWMHLVNIFGSSLSFPITAGTLETESMTAQKIPIILAIPPIDKNTTQRISADLSPQIRNAFFSKHGAGNA